MEDQETKKLDIIINPVEKISHRSKEYINNLSNQIGKEYFVQGKTWKEISLSHVCSIGLVQYCVKIYKKNNPLAETKRELIRKKIIAEYNGETKISMKVLAEKYHLSPSTVERYIRYDKREKMRQNKIAAILPNELDEKTVIIAEDYLFNDITYKHMSEKYNCSVGCIQYHVKRYLHAHPEISKTRKDQ